MGKVLDVYWHFSKPGDHYLGRILAGMDPKKPAFGELPPHWNFGNAMENADVSNGMYLLFGPILKKHRNTKSCPVALLLRCLACIVYHSEEILAQMLSHPGPSFTNLVILHKPGLLLRLSKLVTTDPIVGVMEAATGIPLYAEMAYQMRNMMNSVQTTVLVDTIKHAMNKKAYDLGNITGLQL